MNGSELSKILSMHNVRPTQQRIAVYEYLLEHRTHPSADIIYKALVKDYPVFSRTTIYNSLNSLLQAGLIRTVSIRSDELLYDANPADHGHFLCSQCRQVYDFDVNEDLLCSLCPKGFTKNQGDVFFTGICPACQKQS